MNTGAGFLTSGHYQHSSIVASAPKEVGPDVYSGMAGQDEERGAGKAMTQAWPLAQDGNSIESNDSQRMIIRKDVAWRVDYSNRDT